MMPASTIAQQVIQAWQLIQQWQIPREALSSYETPECLALLKWSASFEKRCRQENWLSLTLIIKQVSKAINQGLCQLPDSVIFAGFEDPNQLHQQLMDSMATQNCHVNWFEHRPIV